MTALYHYTARDAAGEFIAGSIEAPSDVQALTSLRARSLFVTSLEDAATLKASLSRLAGAGAASRAALTSFFRCFSALVASGIAIRRALEVTCQECADRRLREALQGVCADIENGLSLSDALERRPKEFARLWVAMIRAGEFGGILDTVLNTIADALEREAALRKRLVGALIYPCFVACTAVGLVGFLLVSVVPTFQREYEQMHVPLPAITTIMIRLAALVRSPEVLCVLAAGALCGAGAWRIRGFKETCAAFAERVAFRIPAVASLVRKISLARLARLVCALLGAGVGISAALELSAASMSSARYRDALEELRRALDRGDALSGRLAASPLFDGIFVQMVRAGEETGTLDVMLTRVADYYEVEAETSLTALATLVEPAMILVVGAAVGTIVSSVFIPLYTLIGSFK
jgi:type IV pilus assembly protein PilC